MKVVIIGAGPAGLVTCKTLIESATPDFPFDPVILEQEADIGGGLCQCSSRAASTTYESSSGTFRYRSYEVRHTVLFLQTSNDDDAQNANLVSSKQVDDMLM